MSGGANFGAMQAGALEIIVNAGIRPPIAVGTSAGALNSLYYAMDPTPEGMDRLVQAWREVGNKEVGMPKLLTSVRRLITGQAGLIPSLPLAKFLESQFPPEVRTFEQLSALHGIRAYAVAVSMEESKTTVFGDREDDNIIDGAMASTAVPPFYPPWEVKGVRYLDGGIRAKLPLSLAIERGATQILALDICDAMGSLEQATTMITISGYSLSMMVDDQTRREIASAQASGVPIRMFRLSPPSDIDFWNYEEVERLIDAGREQARRFLELEPHRAIAPWRVKLRKSLASLLQRVIS
jgi:NTE family protein